MSNIQTIGVDLAKNVFSIHGVDAIDMYFFRLYGLPVVRYYLPIW